MSADKKFNHWDYCKRLPDGGLEYRFPFVNTGISRQLQEECVHPERFITGAVRGLLVLKSCYQLEVCHGK
jgi:hypothetical protein